MIFFYISALFFTLFPYIGFLSQGTQPISFVMLAVLAFINRPFFVAIAFLFSLCWSQFDLLIYFISNQYFDFDILIRSFLLAFSPAIFLSASEYILSRTYYLNLTLKLIRLLIIVQFLLGYFFRNIHLIINEALVGPIRGINLETIWFFAPEPGFGAWSILLFGLISLGINKSVFLKYDFLIVGVCLIAIGNMTSYLLLTFFFCFSIFILSRSAWVPSIIYASLFFTFMFFTSSFFPVRVLDRIDQLVNIENYPLSSPAIRISELVTLAKNIIALELFDPSLNGSAVGILTYINLHPFSTLFFIFFIFLRLAVPFQIIAIVMLVLLPALSPFFLLLFMSNKLLLGKANLRINISTRL